MLLTEAEKRSHTYKVFFFIHDTIDNGILKNDGSLTMVNNNLCARDKDGQFLGNKYDKSESLYGLQFLERNYMTLMMYNPNLCLQPDKINPVRISKDRVSRYQGGRLWIKSHLG